MIQKEIEKEIINKFIKSRPNKPEMTAATTLLCYAAIDVCKGNKAERLCGKRIISSLFRRNEISNIKTKQFIQTISKMRIYNLASYLIKLKPYTEMSKKLSFEA